MDRRDRETRRSRSRDTWKRTLERRRSRSRSRSRRRRSRSKERRRSRSRERKRSRSRRRSISLERRRSRSNERRRRSRSRDRRRSRSPGRYRSRSRDRRSRSWSKTQRYHSSPKRNTFGSGSVSPSPRQAEWHIKEIVDVRKVHERDSSREQRREKWKKDHFDRKRERDGKEEKYGSHKLESRKEVEIVEISKERRSNSLEQRNNTRSEGLLKVERRYSGERPPSPLEPPSASPAADVTSYFSQKIGTFQEKCGSVQKQPYPPLPPTPRSTGAPKDPRIQPRPPKLEADLASSSKVQYSDSGERGVSPPRGDDTRVTLVTDEESRFEDQTEPVFLDIHSLDGTAISHMKVYLFSHGKCQELQGREPASLVNGFLKYLRKYYPAPRLHQRMVLVTSCTPAYGLLLSTLASQPESRQVFEAYFHHWTDLTTLAARCLSSKEGFEALSMRAVEFRSGRTEQLLRQLRHPAPIATTDSVLMMKEVLDEILPGSGLRGEQQFDASRLLELSSPCLLSETSYLIVLVHIGLLEREGGRTAQLGTIGFRNNHRGSWFVPLDPSRTPHVTNSSAEALGFVKAGEGWSWGKDGSLACLGEAEALLCLLSALTAERANCGAKAVVLVTPRKDPRAVGALVAALAKSGHLPAFLQLVSGLGDMETLAKTKGIPFNTGGLEPFNTYWQRSHGSTLDCAKTETVPKALFQVLEALVGASPNYANYIQTHVHPIHSPYTNSLLLASKVSELREDHYRVLLLAKVSLKPNGMELVSAVLEGVPKLEVGHEFQLLENGKVKFGWNKVKLAANCHLVITLQNSGSTALILEKGEALGWGARSPDDPPPVPSPYIPSNFSYTQLGNKRISDVRQPPPKIISPYEPTKLPSQYAPTTPQYTSQLIPNVPVNVPFTSPPPPLRPKVPKIPLEPKIQGPRSPPEPQVTSPQVPNRDRISQQPLSRDPRGPRHKRQLPGTWGASSSLDPLAQAHQGVTRMLNEDGPPVVRPPSPTVRHERASPPKPVPRRDPRLLAVRIEKKQAVPFSKKVLEDHGITQPQGNPKYFAPGQQFSPMLDLLPGSQKSRLWAAENRQGFLQATPLHQEPPRVGFRQEMSLVDAKKKTHPLFFKADSSSYGDGITTQTYTKWTGDKDELMKKKFRESEGNDSKDKNDNKSRVEKVKKKSSKNSEDKSRRVNGKSGGNSAKEEIFLKKNKKKKAKEAAKQDRDQEKQRKEKKKSKTDKKNVDDDFIQRVWAEASLSVKTTSKDLDKNLTERAEKVDQSGKIEKPAKAETPKSPKEAPKLDESVVLRNEDDLEDEFLAGSAATVESDVDDSDDSNADDVIIRSDIDESSESDSDTMSVSAKIWTGEHKVCPLCKEDFHSLQAYRLHYRSPHTDKCPLCKLVFNSEDKLEEHIEESHNLEERKAAMSLKHARMKSDSPNKGKKSDKPESVLATKKAKKVLKKSKQHPRKAQNTEDMDNEERAEEEVILDSKYCQKKCCSDFRGTYTTVVPQVVAVDDADIPFMETVVIYNGTEGGQDIIPCKKCELRFPTERDLFTHGLLVHQEGWTFARSKEKLAKPGETPSGPFNCNTCKETINTWIALTKHLWQPHLFKCEYCDFAFNRNTKLEDHTNKTHNLVGLIEVTQCGLCGESFARSSSLARHVAAPHPFPCHSCEATFQTKAALKRHAAVCAKGIAQAIISTCIDNMDIN